MILVHLRIVSHSFVIPVQYCNKSLPHRPLACLMNNPSAPGQRVKIDLGDGATAYVEVPSFRGEVAAGAAFPFDQVLGTIRAISSKLNDTLRQVRPSKASITYGIELAVENGSLMATIVLGTGSASFEITLEWDLPHEPAN